jgi:hypothetical protein
MRPPWPAPPRVVTPVDLSRASVFGMVLLILPIGIGLSRVVRTPLGGLLAILAGPVILLAMNAAAGAGAMSWELVVSAAVALGGFALGRAAYPDSVSFDSPVSQATLPREGTPGSGR